MNFHDKVVPGVGAFSAWSLSRRDGELLGGDADRPSGLEFLLACFSN